MITEAPLVYSSTTSEGNHQVRLVGALSRIIEVLDAKNYGATKGIWHLCHTASDQPDCSKQSTIMGGVQQMNGVSHTNSRRPRW